MAINKRMADRLVADGLIGADDYVYVLEHAKRHGARVEEALLALGVIDEAKLLKYIATQHKTQFVSTERMSKAKLDRAGLKLVSYKMAKHFSVFPLVLDRDNDKLIIATADPDNTLAIKELQMACRVGRVLPMVARPAAVEAAIARGYEGDRSLFDRLLDRRAPAEELLSGREPATGSAPPVAGLDAPFEEEGALDWDPEPTPDLGSRPLPLPPRAFEDPPRPSTDPGYRDPRGDEPDSQRLLPGRGSPPAPYHARVDDVDPPSDPTPKGYSGPPPSGEPRVVSSSHRSIIPPAERLSHAALTFGPVTGRAERLTNRPQPAQVLTSAPFLESLRVLVGLLENDRADLRGHSSAVARLCLDVCERIAMPKDLANAVVLAAYLHDLGKMGPHHLTALNAAIDGEHRKRAQKLYSIPYKLMETVGLPPETVDALRCMYEQMNGRGLPDGMHGRDTPMGARILAAVDTYADLTRNANNLVGKLHSSAEAIAVLRDHVGTVFDANIVSVLERSTGGEKILTDLLVDRHRVLIVDPDPEETMVLQLRLADQGFDVHVARRLAEARDALSAHEFALVVSEVDLDRPGDGFELRSSAPRSSTTMSWVLLSSSDKRELAERAFELGVDDFLTKPVATEIVVAKLMQLVEKQSTRLAPRGVSGSLSEMSLPDIVQILWHGRKTCALRVTSGDAAGEIHFSKGHIVNARWGSEEGEQAFYRLLAVGESGEFAVDPEFRPERTVIRTSPEALLLEGMRLMDEGGRA